MAYSVNIVCPITADLLCTGKENYSIPEKGLAHNVVLNLVSGLEQKGYHLHTDNFYSSPAIFLDLYGKGFEATGTVRVNRKRLSKQFQEAKLKKGEKFRGITSSLYLASKLYHTFTDEVYSEIIDNTITCLKWKDKREVSLISTCPHTGFIDVTRRARSVEEGTETIRKPQLIHDYNINMGGVDISDQLVRYYCYPHRLEQN